MQSAVAANATAVSVGRHRCVASLEWALANAQLPSERGGKAAQRNTPPFITPCSHPFTLQRPRNPPPSPNLTTSEWWYSESRMCHTSKTHNQVHSHTTAEFKFDQQILSKRCAERRRELGGYSRHVMMQLRNILCEKVWESFWRMMRKLRQVTPLINNFMKKMRRKAQGARRL